MIKIARLSLLTTWLVLGLPGLPAVAQQVSYQYVGSYAVSDGDLWTNNPPVYSAQEVAALLFGGSPGDYAISINSNITDPNTITHTGWYSGWGEECTSLSEGYKLDLPPPGYDDPQGINTARSAYVQDHCGMPSIGFYPPGFPFVNYVWRARQMAANAPIPTLQEWALGLMGLLLGGLIWHRSRRKESLEA
ncbi:MAG: IPTL-CTERM sorting domain-containing protein [Candidatus Contendobacter sp.]